MISFCPPVEIAMKTFLKTFSFILIFSIFFCDQAFSNTPPIPFSPYADLTLSVHWDPNYQDLEPFDWVQESVKNGVHSYHLAFITDAGTCSPAWGGQGSYSVDSGWGSHLAQ